MNNQMQIIGPAKIKDGLFIGDEYAAKDIEFILNNKVTHIINCSGKQIQNLFCSFGVQYLTFPWLENDQENIFDNQHENINSIYNFITKAWDKGESALVHSQRGQSRSCCMIAAFMMKRYYDRYKWTLYKTLEYLNSRKEDLEIRTNFFNQLANYEQFLIQTKQITSNNWDQTGIGLVQENELAKEELLVRNTFLNSRNSLQLSSSMQIKLQQQNLKPNNSKKSIKKLFWIDQSIPHKSLITQIIPPYSEENQYLEQKKQIYNKLFLRQKQNTLQNQKQQENNDNQKAENNNRYNTKLNQLVNLRSSSVPKNLNEDRFDIEEKQEKKKKFILQELKNIEKNGGKISYQPIYLSKYMKQQQQQVENKNENLPINNNKNQSLNMPLEDDSLVFSNQKQQHLYKARKEKQKFTNIKPSTPQQQNQKLCNLRPTSHQQNFSVSLPQTLSSFNQDIYHSVQSNQKQSQLPRSYSPCVKILERKNKQKLLVNPQQHYNYNQTIQLGKNNSFRHASPKGFSFSLPINNKFLIQESKQGNSLQQNAIQNLIQQCYLQNKWNKAKPVWKN